MCSCCGARLAKGVWRAACAPRETACGYLMQLIPQLYRQQAFEDEEHLVLLVGSRQSSG
jgi:hypothetical protein